MRSFNALLRIPPLTLVAFLAVALATPAEAGIGKGNGELGFDFGFTEFDSNTSNETGTFGTIRGGYHFNKLFQLEASFGASIADEVFGDQTLSTFFVNAVFNFHPKENIVPYFLVGVGRANLEVDFFGFTVDDDAAAYQAAFGSRFFFGRNKRAAFRVEASVISEDTFGQSSTHTNLGGGFTWRLGAAP